MTKTKILVPLNKKPSGQKLVGTKASKSAPKIPAVNNRKVTKKSGVRPTAKKITPTNLPEKDIDSRQQVQVNPLDHAEASLNSAIEAMNHHMDAAIRAIEKIANVREDQEQKVIRTTPIDRASAVFRRLISEVVDNQLAEILLPLVALRNEMTGFLSGSGSADLANDVRARIYETLDHVLTLAGVKLYEARVGESFDSLIHLAVGETHRGDLANGVISEQHQPGFRFANGKVISPAKVSINRR